MASEYLKWKYRDVKPDVPRTYTKEELRKNWWDYHKWHVVISVILLIALFDILKNAFHIGEVRPDIQIAYVCEHELPEDAINKVEKALTAYIDDYNQDGKTILKINQYRAYFSQNATTDEQATYTQAAQVSLMGDIETRDSFIFIVDDCLQFQEDYAVLANKDGTKAKLIGLSNDQLGFLWKDLDKFNQLDLGDYTESIAGETLTGNIQSILENKYLCIRAYPNQKPDSYEEFMDLWFTLTNQ